MGSSTRPCAIRYYNAWRYSPIHLQREFVKGLKGLLCMGYYSQPEAMESIGYTPDKWVAKVKRRRLEIYGDDIRRHEETMFVPDPLPTLGVSAEPREADDSKEAD